MKIVHEKGRYKLIQVVKMTIVLGGLALATESLARKPAIDPVQGISIDQYKEVKPSEDPGFNFSGTEERVPAANKAQAPSTTIEKPEGKNISWWPLFALPVGLFFLMRSKFKKQKEEVTLPENVVALPTRKTTEQEDYKKAG